VRETKIVPREKNTAKVKQTREKWQYFKCGDNHMVKEDKMPNLGPFTRNPGVKQILSDPTKLWWITELFSETTSLRCYARRLICIIFKIKENIVTCYPGNA
jgi:hypothetical protein